MISEIECMSNEEFLSLTIGMNVYHRLSGLIEYLINVTPSLEDIIHSCQLNMVSIKYSHSID